MNLLDLIFPKKCLECGKERKYICDGCIEKVTSTKCNNLDYSPFKYQGVIRKAIISLKYKFAYDIAEELAVAVSEKVKNGDLKLKDVVLMPIPLHKSRQNWRGFNQSEIVGEKLTKIMNWKYIPDFLIRTKKTEPQVGLRGSTRQSNISGVFSINQKHSLSFTTHDSLILFDDVYTTGSTINEARKVLKEAGFKNIKSLTIAR